MSNRFLLEMNIRKHLCWIFFVLTPGPPDHAPPRKNNQGRVGGPKILAPLSCALTIGALLDTSKYKKVSCSEPLDVTILLPRYQT